MTSVSIVSGDTVSATVNTAHGKFSYDGPTGPHYNAWKRRMALLSRAQEFKIAQYKVLSDFTMGFLQGANITYPFHKR
jgi:hypothetical protein